MRIRLTALVCALACAPAQVSAESSEFLFTASGDFGANANTRVALNSIAAAKPAFHLALGDLSYGEVTPESAWCDFVKTSIGPTFPFQLIPGNHDTPESADGDIKKFAACFPNRMEGMVGNYPIRYFFDYPKSRKKPLARFIVVSPGIDFGGFTYAFKKGDGDHSWLAQTIDSARKDGIRWIVVSMHKNCLSVGDKSCDVGTDVMALLHEKNVDLILQGHDHLYARTKPLRCLKANVFDASCIVNESKTNYRQGEGVITVVAGTGGIGLYKVRDSDPEAPYFVKYSGKNSEDASYGFVKFRVSEKELKGEFLPVKAVAKKPLKDQFAIQAK